MYNKHLDSFVRTAQLGSFAKAATTLFISPTALIQQINLLEKRLGVQLFVRTARGVTLTASGKSILQDAESIIRLSGDAIERAQALDGKSANTIRVGTSFINKCRFLPRLWEKLIDIHPEMRIEIVSMRNPVEATRSPLTDLGVDFDIREGFFFDGLFKGRGNFLEFFKSPVCIAVPTSNRLSSFKRITWDDLAQQTIVMCEPGISEEFDAIRQELSVRYLKIEIISVPAFDVNVFTMCEFNGYVIITTEIWSDIHPSLLTKKAEWGYSIPYGVLYPLNPSPPAQQFLVFVKENHPGNLSKP
jgi:DNA-binding transcriptional LysR family regulator